MGFFSQPFCQATTQAGTTVCKYVVLQDLYPGLSPQRAPCVRVQPWYGVQYVCLMCWEVRNVPGPWGASSRVCQPSMSRIYL